MDRNAFAHLDPATAGRLDPAAPPLRPGTDVHDEPERHVQIADPKMDTALDQLILLIEHQVPAMRGSILLLDEDGITMHHAAGPNLAPEYCQLIDGSRIGPSAGSCGTAAYRREQVIVEDIATDPLWDDYRALASPFGLRACWSTPFMDSEGTVLGTFAMYSDEPRGPTALERKLIETATMLASSIVLRARAAEALTRSEERTRVARAEAERANRIKTDFLAKMSHELRTPLNAIGGYAMLMLDGIPDPSTEAQRGYLERIVKAQNHLLTLVDALLTHAKIEAGEMTYRLEAVRLEEILDAVDALVAPQVAAKGLDYECSGCDPDLTLHCDRDKTVQVVLNLMSNAVKFTPAGGRVTIRTLVPEGKNATIAVRDTGVGMSRQQVERLFQPFVQFDNALDRRQKGTGLGAAISRELARGMGGELEAESQEGKGTEFFLSLPLATGHLDRNAPDSSI